MASTNFGGFAPLTSAFVGSFVQYEGNAHAAYLGMLSLPVAGSRDATYPKAAMLGMRVRVPIFFLRGQFGGITERWIGSSPDTPPPSGNAVTNRSYIVLDQ